MLDVYTANQQPPELPVPVSGVLRFAHLAETALQPLLSVYGLELFRVPAGQAIPGSYWGDAEAGLIGKRLLVRADTPVHSLLHEACHYICMEPARRAQLDTHAGGDDLEECAVCYLQILLADQIPGFGRARMWSDMDAWGYSFRLGSAQAWFENDAEDARAWLLTEGLIDPQALPTGRLRGTVAAD